MVLVAWYNTAEQLRLAARDDGLVYVRLGRRAGGLHVQPNIARVRHILMHTHEGIVAPGLFSLREPGFRVYTRSELEPELEKRAAGIGLAAWKGEVPSGEGYIYALFQCQLDLRFRMERWDAGMVMKLLQAFESDARNKPVENIGRRSAFPRILPLRELLKARIRAC